MGSTSVGDRDFVYVGKIVWAVVKVLGAPFSLVACLDCELQRMQSISGIDIVQDMHQRSTFGTVADGIEQVLLEAGGGNDVAQHDAGLLVFVASTIEPADQLESGMYEFCPLLAVGHGYRRG